MQSNRKRTLLDKWRLVRAAARDNKRLSAGDVSVLLALCDRYGNQTDPDRPPMAGHALLAAMSGLSRRGTIDSTRRLVEAGYISVLDLGKGNRGTVYNLHFDRGEAEFITATESLSGEPEFTTAVNHTSPLEGTSGEVHFTESPSTVAPLRRGLRVEGSMFDATPSAPLAGGSEATAARRASGDFAEFWLIWPRRHGKTKAHAAWDKLTIENRIAALAAAPTWAAHYATHNVNRKWIPEPANWLFKERCDEDLPIIHADSKGAAIAKAKANAPQKADPLEIPLSKAVSSPRGLFEGKIVSSELTDMPDGSQEVRLYLEIANARGRTDLMHVFRLGGSSGGHNVIESLQAAMGIETDIEDLEEFHCKLVLVAIDPLGNVSYAPLVPAKLAA